jgi:hypothetical protein
VGTDDNGIFLATKTGIFNVRASLGSIMSQSVNVNVFSSPLQSSVITFSDFTTSNKTPARGEDVMASFKLKNNLSNSITIDAVGAVGRIDSPYTGPNRDFGWQGPVTFAAGEAKKLHLYKDNN